MKKNIWKILIVLILLLVGCNTKDEFLQDFPYMKETEHVFKKANYQEVVNAFTVNPGINVVLFAFNPNYADCPFCHSAIPLLNEAALETGIERILYIDIYNMRKERNANYLILLGYLDGYVQDLIERDGLKEIIVPDVYFIKDGIILGHHIATVKDEDDRYIYNLNDEEKAQLKSIYLTLFRK